MTAALVVAGCNTTGLFDKKEPETQAPEYVPGEGDELSPLEAHLRARHMVDPTDNDNSSYTYKADQPHDDYYSRLKNETDTPDAASPIEAPEHQGQFADNVEMDSAPQGRTGRITPETRVPLPGLKPLPPQRMANAVMIDGSPLSIPPEEPAAPPLPPQKPQGDLRPQDMQEPSAHADAGAPAEDAPLSSIHGDTNVTGMRLGEHPGRTRLVLDLSGKSGYGYHIDNAGGVLRIELPGAGWGIEPSRNFSGHPLFSGYSVGALSEGGTVLNISLKRPVKIDNAVALPPNESYGHRIYFDVTGG